MPALTILLTSLLALQAPRGSADDDPEPPRPGPIGVRLVAKKATYRLDFRGHKKEDYVAEAKRGAVPPPAVDLELVLTNHTRGNVRIRSAGSTNRLTLTLKGSGAIEAPSNPGVKRPRIQYTILRPGDKLTIPIDRLAGLGLRGKKLGATGETYHYWTEPGEYTLSASFYTLVVTNFNGGNPTSRYQTLTAKPVTVKVEK